MYDIANQLSTQAAPRKTKLFSTQDLPEHIHELNRKGDRSTKTDHHAIVITVVNSILL